MRFWILPGLVLVLSTSGLCDDARKEILPEAIFSNLGLIFLAHTHIPTVWDEKGVRVPPVEWTRKADGSLENACTLPNGVAFGARVVPRRASVDMELWLRNGSKEPLSKLRTQICVMLKGARKHNGQTNDNKFMAEPAVAVRSADGQRWVITAWDHCGRVWCNPPVPCMHSDPVLPDCRPGETVRVRGRLFFYQGTDIQAEVNRRKP